MHRPRLAGVVVRGLDISGSHSPPLVADGDWRQTGEHLSPWRGIWCGTKLNTMHGHGIPSELSHGLHKKSEPLPDRFPGTLLAAVRG